MRVVQSILNLYTQFLMATDHAKQAAVGIFAGLSANSILCIVLIPQIGFAGAAVGAFVNAGISLVIARMYLGRIIPLSCERRTLTHIVLATIVMTISLLVLGMLPLHPGAPGTMMMVITGGAVYGAVLLHLNQQLRNDAFRTLHIRWIPK
jgi:O-antigen/teichoic acid export membrane protein